ncbi:MAG: ABC transporter permease, partial [Lacticaseibacillus paracasei]|nr:ABC transporter permease [Lacticaseibacillus paracasei]
MGTMTHLVWRQLIKEKARTFTTILAMAVAATLTVATLIGINSARHSMYQDNIQNTGGLQFVLSKVNQETALAIQKKADISESVRYQQQGQISFADQVPNQPDSPLLMLPKPALQRLIQPILLEGRLPQNEQEVMLAQDLISDVYAVGKTVAAQRNGQRVVLKIVGSYRGYAGLMASDGAVTTGHFDGTKNYAVAAAFGNYGNFYAKLKKLTAQYHVGSDQQRMNELALKRAGESRDVKVRAMFVLLVIVVLSVIGLVSLALIYTSINL